MARRARGWWPPPPPRLAGLGIGDVLEAMEASASCDPDRLWPDGTRAMARYGICARPDGGDGVDISGHFADRVKEVAREDGSYWRAIPQAVYDWSGGRATAEEMGFATAVYAMGRRGLAARVRRDVGAAAEGDAPAGRRGARREARVAARPAREGAGAAPGKAPAGGITPEDVMEIVNASVLANPGRADMTARGIEAMARYGIAEPPPPGSDYPVSAAFDRRVDEIARADGSHWRAVPQAIREWSGGRATPLETDLVTTAYLMVRGDPGLSERVIDDMAAVGRRPEAACRRPRRPGPRGGGARRPGAARRRPERPGPLAGRAARRPAGAPPAPSEARRVIMRPPPRRRVEGLGTADVMRALAAAAGTDPEATWKAGGEALARYGITDRPPDEGLVGIDAGFEERVEEIAAADGGHWRAIPQAVLEWSEGRATLEEIGCATAVYVSRDAALGDRLLRDLDAAAERGDAAARRGGRRP